MLLGTVVSESRLDVNSPRRAFLLLGDFRTSGEGYCSDARIIASRRVFPKLFSPAYVRFRKLFLIIALILLNRFFGLGTLAATSWM